MTSKIILLSEIFPPRHGGSGNWFYELYRRIDSEFAVVTDKFERLSANERIDNLNVYRIGMQPKSIRDMGILSLTGLKYYFRLVRSVRNICKKENVSVVHCGKILPEGLIGLFLKMFFGYKYLVYIHGEDIEGALLSKEYKILVRLVLKYSDFIICNSKNSVHLLEKWGDDLSNKTEVLYPGVDVEKFMRRPEHVSQYTDKKVILTVSRLQKRKGHDYLLKALPKIAKQIPNVHYVIIGDGEEKENLKDIITQLNLSDRVDLLDGIGNDQLVEHYSAADLFVLPNRRVGNDIEGLGIVLLEAQSCGTAVIAGDSGGTVETIIPGVTGLIVDCTNLFAIEESIVNLLKDKIKLDEMEVAARLHIESKFSWAAQVDKAIEIFDRL